MVEVHRLRIKHPVPIVLEGFRILKVWIIKLLRVLIISSLCTQFIQDILLRKITSRLRQVISKFALLAFAVVTIQIHREDSRYLPLPVSPWACLRRSLRELRIWEEGMNILIRNTWHLDLHQLFDTQLQVTVRWIFHSPFFWLDDDREDILPIRRGYHLPISILLHLTEVESCLDLVLDGVPVDAWAVSIARRVERELDATSVGTLGKLDIGT